MNPNDANAKIRECYHIKKCLMISKGKFKYREKKNLLNDQSIYWVLIKMYNATAQLMDRNP